MFGFFKPKTKKAVEKWEHDHEKIVELATNIIASWNKNEIKKTRHYLKELNKHAIDHLMDEDLELFHFKRGDYKVHIDEDTKQKIEEFLTSFKSTKMALMDFLRQYNKEDAELDDEFMKQFMELVEVLKKRIEFEENTLYKALRATK